LPTIKSKKYNVTHGRWESARGGIIRRKEAGICGTSQSCGNANWGRGGIVAELIPRSFGLQAREFFKESQLINSHVSDPNAER
jgi:hypothetical protein